MKLHSYLFLFFVVLFGFGASTQAARFKPNRKSTKDEISFRSQDPKTFYRSLNPLLEQQSPDGVVSIKARATVADILFKTENYREAAQIYLQLTDIPMADQYQFSSFQYRLAESYFYMGLYGEAYDQFSRIRQEGHQSLKNEAILGMAMAALAQGNRSSAQAHMDILLLENDYYKTYGRALYPIGIMLFQNEQYQRSLGFFERDQEDSKNIYFSGISYRRLGQMSKALLNFQRLTQKFPGTVWAQRGSFEVAETYYQQKDFPLAAQSFQRGLVEYPNGTLGAEAQFRIACTDIHKKQYQAVLNRLEPMTKLDLRPSMMDKIKHLVIESWVQLDRVQDLVNNIKKKGRARDRSPDENYQLMWALAALGKHQEALAQAEEGLGNFRDVELTPKILLVQGFCYDKLNKSAEALASFQTVVDQFPKSAYAARALHLMALSYVKAQRWQELVTHVNHYWAELPSDLREKYPEVEFWITEGHLSLGNFNLAESRYQQFLSKAPNDTLTPYAYLGLAVAKAQNNKMDAGLQTLQQFASLAKQKNREDWMSLATLQSANVYYNQKKYEQAIGYYRSFQKDYPKDPKIPQALYQEGQALSRLEYYTDAVNVWEKLVDVYPQNSLSEKAQFQTARTLFDLGNTTAAVKAYQTYIVKYPASDKIKGARLQLAHSYYNAGDYKSAIPRYQEFLALYPNAEEAISVQDFLQMSYVQAGKSELEIEKLTMGQAKSQVLADLYWEKGAKAYNDKDYKAALIYFEKILIDFPASSLAAQSAFYRGECFYLDQKYDEATGAYRNFVIQFPNDNSAPTAQFRLGVSLFNLNRFEEAALTFQDLVKKYPDAPEAATAAENIPLAYAKIGRMEESEQAFEKLAQNTSDPIKKASLNLQIGQMKEKNGLAAEAIKYYEQVPVNHPQYAEAVYSVASIYSKSGQVDLEQKSYEKLLSVDPKNDPYRIAGISRLAEIYIGLGQAQKALDTYGDVVINASDETALSNAKSRVEELKRVLQQ
ncbi:MAG: tetratricopeptide repeat protein [Elusimicrobiota bacterium]